MHKLRIYSILAVALTALLSTTSQAQPPGAVRELIELRSANAKHWLNTDGSKTAEISLVPVHYLDSADFWQDIDATPVAAVKPGFSHSVVKNWFKTDFATQASGWNVVEVDGVAFRFTADVVNSPSLSGVNGGAITYPNTWPDVDVKYQVGPTGIKEEIILKKQPKQNEFRFMVDSGGLRPMAEGRGINFVDAKGVVRVRIPGPFMYDSDGEVSDAVDATFETLSDGNIRLVLRPDAAWLAQAAYPVIIDPTLTFYPDPYQSQNNGKDGYISGTTWNYDQTYLAMRIRSPANIACVQFDLTDPVLPQNAVVSAASISLSAIAGISPSYTVYMKRNTSEWLPSSPPSTDGVTLASATWSSYGTKTFSGTAVTELVQKWAWQEAGYINYGVQFTTGATADLQCSSREAAAGWPSMSVTYDVDTTPPTPGTPTAPAYDNSSPIGIDYTGAADTGTPQSGLKTVELWYKKGYSGAWTNTSQTLSTPTGHFDFTPSENDTYYFALRAQDKAGNWSPTPSGDSTCYTIYVSDGPSTTGRAYIQSEYLYPSGYKKRVTIINEAGEKFRQVSINYGAEGEVLSASGNVQQSSLTYDSLYRVKTLIDPNNQQTTYTYDLAGRLTRIDLPGGENIQYTAFDPSGRVTSMTDSRGQVINFDYNDPSCHLTDKHYVNNATYDVSYDYDDIYGWCTSVTDNEGVTTYQHDDRGGITGVTTTYTGLPSRTINYGFYDNGSLSTMNTPAGAFNYTYDAAGRPLGLTNPFSEPFSWTYYNNSWLLTQATPVSVTTYAFDPKGWLSSLTNRSTGGTLLSEFTGTSGMVYDTVGNLLSVTANIPSVPGLSGVTDYGYDQLDQLLSETSTRNSGFSFPFIYDGAGNPTTFKGLAHTFDGIKNQRSDPGFIYDSGGNPTTYKGVAGLQYNPANRLINYPGFYTAGYHNGIRAWKQDTGAGTRKYFLYNGSVPVCEMDAAGNVIATNTYGPEGLLARREGLSSYFYNFDQQGNTAQLLDVGGNILTTELYDAYGNRLAGTNTTPFGYCGQYSYYTDRNAEGITSLIYCVNRYYDPTEGRWLTRDPIGYAGGINLYAYCGENPMNYVDPLGLCGERGDDEGTLEKIYNLPSTFVNWLASGTVYEGPSMQDGGKGNEELANDPDIPFADEYFNRVPRAGKAAHDLVNQIINEVGWALIQEGIVRVLPGPEPGVGGGRGIKPPGGGSGGSGVKPRPIIPDNANQILKYIENTGSAPQGYKGGRIFQNRELILPTHDAKCNPVTYIEYDIHPLQTGVNRGAERIVIGNDGSAYYTADHYGSFIKMK